MKLAQEVDFILAEYKKTFAEEEEVDPLRQTYWLGCYSADTAPIIENLPTAPFGMIVETPAFGDLHQLWFETFKDLIRAGLKVFNSYGPRSNELEDVFDWAGVFVDVEQNAEGSGEFDVLPSGSDDRLPEAIEFNEWMAGLGTESWRTTSCVVLTLCP